MNTKTARLMMLSPLVLAVLACGACRKKEADKTTAQAVQPAAIEVATAARTANVESVDDAKRTVTLKTSDGTTRTYKVGKDVVNFDQIKPGDSVNAVLVEAMAVYVRKVGAPPSAGAGDLVALAPRGAKPGIIMAETAELTDKVEAVDPEDHTITLEGEAGKPKTFKVAPGVRLADLKKGDDVVLRCTKGVALLVEKPEGGVAAGPGAPAVGQGAPMGEDDARAIGTEAYIYGYPLVTMEMTRRVMTNVEKPEGTRAPMGQLVRAREYPTPAFKDVTAPNADTLYTTAWIEVCSEPWVLSLPDAHDRYYLMPMLDGWTNVFEVPGKRTTGTGPQKYAITGPGFKGTLPEGVKEYRSPTSMVWILGRIYCDGSPEDYKAVHAMQDEISLVPLSAYGKPYAPPPGQVDPAIDMKTPVRDQVNAMDAATFFKMLATLMKDNPPAEADAPLVARLAKIGIVPGQAFDMSKLDPAAAKGLQDVPKRGVEKIMAHLTEAGKQVNGWTVTLKAGVYGTDYIQRATITAIGLGANRPQDAVYPTSEADAQGRPYDGSKSYVLHFDKGKLPPVNGFWSLTMYDADYFFVPNPLNRYTLSQRDKFNLTPDGSVDLYLQNVSPGPDREANWLPAPAGKFVVMLRLYWPKESPPSILDGTWEPPPVEQQMAPHEAGR